MIDFVHPWIFALAPAPLLVRWIVPARRAARLAVRVPFLDRVVAAGGRVAQAAPDGRLRQAARWFVWLALLVAAARPQRLEPPLERTIPTRDLLLVVDLSGSMEQQDFAGPDGRPIDRLEAVKQVVGDFLERREGDRVGLVVFGTKPFLQTPFTTDLPLCREMLEETAVRMAGPRTALGDAIGLGIKLLEESDAPTKTMIVLTDGNDTSSDVPPVEAARVAADRGVTVHAVAIGDPTTVGEEALDEATLREMVGETGGEYFLAMDRAELQRVYERLDGLETREAKSILHRPRRDLYPWPVAAALCVELLAQIGLLAARRAARVPAGRSARLRVNPRTFELETYDA